jgi:hypothetical protein
MNTDEAANAFIKSVNVGASSIPVSFISILRVYCRAEPLENCKFPPNPYAEKDYIWDCASYRWKWEDRSFGRHHGYKTLADACVKRNCGGNNQYFCDDGNLGYVPRKLRKMQLMILGGYRRNGT